MARRLSTIRHAAALRQGGLCWYCGQPMWEDDPEGFALAHGLRRRQVERFRCTAEHLVAKREGGGDGGGNVVAACLYCNATRHRAKVALAPEAYRARVQRRLARGAWVRVGR